MSESKIQIINEAVRRVATGTKTKRRLDFLSGSYGWEKWFQVELAYELSSHGDALLEAQRAFDGRKQLPDKKVNNSNAFIDILFRKKNDLKEKYAAIEIKLTCTEQGLRQVLQDLVKVRALLSSVWDFRSVIVIFVHGVNDGRRDGKFIRVKTGICAHENVKPIKTEHFEFLVFGWEPARDTTVKMSHETYDTWLEHIKAIFKSEGVEPKTLVKKVARNASLR